MGTARILCQLYELPDPLRLLQQEDAWPKSKWRNWCTTKVCAYHEKLWKEKSLTNSKMLFLNVQLLGLNGRHHPALFGLKTTMQVEKMRPHLKMLSGDYLTYSRIALDRKSGDPSCRICRSYTSQPVAPETIEHILTECKGMAEAPQCPATCPTKPPLFVLPTCFPQTWHNSSTVYLGLHIL